MAPGRTMFSYTDSPADDRLLSTSDDLALIASANDAVRLEKQAAARKVLCAYRTHVVIAADMQESPTASRVKDGPDKTAIGQVSRRLGVSVPIARKWVRLGAQLQDLPRVRMAFLEGRFSVDRARIVAEELAVLPDEMRAGGEVDALTLVDRATTDKILRRQLADYVLSRAPERAPQAREEFSRQRSNVVIRDEVHGHTSISATVPAEHGVWLDEQITALITARLCGGDPRTFGQRRADALAEVNGVPGAHLACRCGDASCPAEPEVPAAAESAAEPTVDAQPAAAESANPAATPADAVPPAADSFEPAVPTEPTEPDVDDSELAECDAAIDPDAIDPVVTETDTDTDGSAQTRHDPAPTGHGLTIIADSAGDLAPDLSGYGPIDPAHAVALTSGDAFAAEQVTIVKQPRRTPMVILLGQRAGPPRAVDSSGHGGLSAPPPGALTYHPSKAVREQVYSTDDICRYPWCDRRVADCQLDHVVRFDHLDPRRGGWSISDNLIPLCPVDHQRKHMGLLIPTLLEERIVSWYDPITKLTLATYAY